MDGYFTFQWAGCFSDGGGFIFKCGGWGGGGLWGASVLMGRGVEKNCWIGGVSPHAPPLWETTLPGSYTYYLGLLVIHNEFAQR